MSNPAVSHDEIQEFAVLATNVGGAVAYFALAAAYFTPTYVEPGYSIDAVDHELGSPQDVEDPLLTAHRLAKFYLISAGEALLSCGDLVGREFPMLVGSAALARTTAEHASRSMYLSDANIDHRARMLRAHALFHVALNEYKSTNADGAMQLVQNWERWKSRTSPEFKGTPKQTAKNARGLIDMYFTDPIGYDELSRPTHGNAVWMSMVVVQEQKRTVFARILTLRNFEFALRCALDAARQLCELWGLDKDQVMANAREQRGVEDQSIDWNSLVEACAQIRDSIHQLNEADHSDITPDPQPRR